MDGGPFCYVSFTLASPPRRTSYLNLHWPEGHGSYDSYGPPAFPCVRAADEDLVLFDISTRTTGRYWDAPPDMFVYTATTRPSPSVQRLPPYTIESNTPFLRHIVTTGILRLKGEDRYIVADINVFCGKNGMCAQLCVFNSAGVKQWTLSPEMPAPQPQGQSNGGRFPNLWSTDNLLAFAGRFLCCIDYMSGVLLCDFVIQDLSPVLRFVPFPGKNEYCNEEPVERCFPDRFRSVSISQGMLCFVHVDSDFHGPPPARKSRGQQKRPTQEITVWTLDSNKFEWKLHHVINLDSFWAQPGYLNLHIDQRLLEFPTISLDDPNVLCCLLTEEEFDDDGWIIMVGNNAHLLSCESVRAEHHHNHIPDTPYFQLSSANTLKVQQGN
ncbi:unnamed protein product [Triticum turgidum subsp. durum]|uniref:DUF1618 domain-containing protein n=1 Tax=Triticum turgidum subsp. durum TaxID=4567 RepID=A0A9R0XKP5_TRITD|nr:unnamed protein product [Triticum turgidum subsp. durum]